MEKTEKGRYKSLYEIAAALNSARVPKSVVSCIVENVTNVMEAKGCALLLLSWDKRILIHAAACGLSDAYITKGFVSADKGISEVLDGKSVHVADATTDERVQYPEAARKEGIASILSVPVMHGEEVTGILRVYTGEQRHFNEDDIYFVRAIAHLGAIALNNVRLYESLQEEYETFRRRTF